MHIKNAKYFFILKFLSNVHKLFLYIKLYGLHRTFWIIKIKSHLASSETFKEDKWTNLNCKDINNPKRSVAIVGAGGFTFSVICFFLMKINKNFLRAVYTPSRKKAISLCKYYNGVYCVSSLNQIKLDKKIKIIFIASPPKNHLDNTLLFINSNVRIYLEKPHVISFKELTKLLNQMIKNPKSKIFLGFNKSSSPIFKILSSHLDNEKGPLFGTILIRMEDKTYFNDPNDFFNFLILEVLCHWTDLVLKLVGIKNVFPCKIYLITKDFKSKRLSFRLVFKNNSSFLFNYSSVNYLAEGIYENFQVSKGDFDGELKNFDSLKYKKGNVSMKIKSWHRDYGHSAHIMNALTNKGDTIEYVKATAFLFLSINDVLKKGENSVININ